MRATSLIDRLYPRSRTSVSLRSLSSPDIQRFLKESELTICELLALARHTNGSKELLRHRLQMIGLDVTGIDLATLGQLAESSSRLDVCAMPAAWPRRAY